MPISRAPPPATDESELSEPSDSSDASSSEGRGEVSKHPTLPAGKVASRSATTRKRPSTRASTSRTSGRAGATRKQKAILKPTKLRNSSRHPPVVETNGEDDCNIQSQNDSDNTDTIPRWPYRPKRKREGTPAPLTGRDKRRRMRVRTPTPEEVLPSLLMAFPQHPAVIQFESQSNIESVAEILEPNWEEADNEKAGKGKGKEKDDDNNAMDIDDHFSSMGSWSSLPRKVLAFNAPTPRLNASTGIVELPLETFEFGYRAMVSQPGIR